MKSPAFQLYTGDFLSSPDVPLMEAHEVGAYCLLLFNSWQSDRPGFLPDDENRLRRTARLTAQQWAESRDLLLGKFPLAPDNPTHRYNPAWRRRLQSKRLSVSAWLPTAARVAAPQTNCFPRKTIWFTKIRPPRPKISP